MLVDGVCACDFAALRIGSATTYDATAESYEGLVCARARAAQHAVNAYPRAFHTLWGD